MNIVVVALAALLPISSLACSAPREQQDDRALIATANRIVLARVVGFEPAILKPRSERRYAIFHFETVETIKGTGYSKFDLSGFANTDPTDTPTDFDRHRAPAFWAGFYSNTISPGDCKYYGTFAVGETYLVFFPEGLHRRAFENIKSKDDVWLGVVKLLASRTTAIP